MPFTRLSLHRWIILTFLLGGLAGCGDSASDPCPTGQVLCDEVCIDEIAPTLEAVHASVFVTSCAVSSACHQSPARAGEGLALDTVEISRAQLIDVPSVQDPQRLRVAPGDASNSYLMNKLDGVNLAPRTLDDEVSERMPLLGTLCEPKIEAVRAWINDAN